MEEEKKEVKKEEKKQDVKSVAKTEKKETKETKKDTKKPETSKETKKKFENAKTAEKKKTNYNAIIAVVVVVAILVIMAIIYTVATANTPQKAVDTMLNALKTANYDKAKEVVADYEEWIGEDILDGEELNEEAQKLFFNEMSWKITKVKEEGDKATVELEITNKDFKTILGNYMQKAIKAAFSGQNISDEEMTNYLLEELNNKEIQKTTNNQSIVLEKQDGKWKVTQENDFTNILLPGFSETINSLNF